MLKFCTFRSQRLCFVKLRRTAVSSSTDGNCGSLKSVPGSLHVSYKRTYLFEKCRAVINNEISIEQLQQDPQFTSVCDTILKDIKNNKDYSRSAKISLLQSFLFMNVDPQWKVVQYLENELLWETKNLNIEEIVECLSFHILHKKTDLQKKVLKELVNACYGKFDEIEKNEKLLLQCWKFYDISVIGEELAKKIEEATLKVLGHSNEAIDNKILLNIVIACSQSKRRNVSILKKISQILDQEKLKDFKDVDLIISVISSLKHLNFPDITFLEKLESPLSGAQINAIKPSAMNALFKSMALLKWRCVPFLDGFIANIDKLNEKLKTQILTSFVMTSARLNYNPENFRQCLENHIFPNVTEKLVNDKRIWLDFVWSLAILNHLTVDHIRSVFNSSFYESALNVEPSEQTFVKMKLANIKAVANLEMNSLFKSPKEIENFVNPLRSYELSRMNNMVINDLNSFLPCDKFMLMDVISPIGAVINAQFVVNRNLKPIPLVKEGEKSIDMSNIPKGYKRVNLLVFNFKDRVLGGNELIGVHNLVIRLLKRLDDNVVVVDDTNYNLSSTAIQRITSLRELIKNSF